jgi:hypothetical protein
MAETPTYDPNGELVHRFALTMGNLGLAKAGHEVQTMLESGRWRRFMLGFQAFEFLPGEFDYFLTQQGITREQIMAIRDVEVKAELEAAMDERRTGEPTYRRTITDVRAQVPDRPGSPIEPYGYTKSEAKALLNGKEVDDPPDHRPALGRAVRRYSLTGGTTTRKPSEQRPRWERLAASVCNLPVDEFAQAYEVIKAAAPAKRREQRACS